MLQRREKRQVLAVKLPRCTAEYVITLVYRRKITQSEKEWNATSPSPNTFYMEPTYCHHCKKASPDLLQSLYSVQKNVLYNEHLGNYESRTIRHLQSLLTPHNTFKILIPGSNYHLHTRNVPSLEIHFLYPSFPYLQFHIHHLCILNLTNFPFSCLNCFFLSTALCSSFHISLSSPCAQTLRSRAS